MFCCALPPAGIGVVEVPHRIRACECEAAPFLFIFLNSMLQCLYHCVDINQLISVQSYMLTASEINRPQNLKMKK